MLACLSQQCLGQSCGIGGALYVVYRAISGLMRVSHKGHTGLAKRSQRLPPSDGKHKHLYGDRYFQNKDGLYIYFRCWKPEKPNGHIVIIVHGLGEHIGRYGNLAANLNSIGFTVYGLDHQGHGASEGDRFHVGSTSDYVDDVIQLRSEIATPQPNRKVFQIGHSMGGLIAILTAMRDPKLFDGHIFSGPAIVPDPKTATPMMVSLAKMLSGCCPKIELDELDTTGTSRSKTNVAQYDLDPLNVHQGMTARLGHALLTSMADVRKNMNTFSQPFLIQQGTADKLCQPQGADKFMEAAISKDKKQIMYEGWYHEIYNEVEEDCKVQTDAKTGVTSNLAVRDVVAWLSERIAEK